MSLTTASVLTTSNADDLSTIEVAQMLGMAVRSVQLMVDRGELQAWKTPGGHRRISRASVDRWLAGRQAGPGASPAAAPPPPSRPGCARRTAGSPPPTTGRPGRSRPPAARERSARRDPRRGWSTGLACRDRSWDVLGDRCAGQAPACDDGNAGGRRPETAGKPPRVAWGAKVAGDPRFLTGD